MKSKSNGPGFLAQQLKTIVKSNQPYSEFGTIISTNKSKLTCTIKLNLNETMIYENVPLAAFGNSGFVPIPLINSQVVVVFTDPLHCVVVQTSEIDKYKFSNSTLDLKSIMLELCDAILNAQYQTPQGPTIPMTMINQLDIQKVKTDLNNLFL